MEPDEPFDRQFRPARDNAQCIHHFQDSRRPRFKVDHQSLMFDLVGEDNGHGPFRPTGDLEVVGARLAIEEQAGAAWSVGEGEPVLLRDAIQDASDRLPDRGPGPQAAAEDPEHGFAVSSDDRPGRSISPIRAGHDACSRRPRRAARTARFAAKCRRASSYTQLSLEPLAGQLSGGAHVGVQAFESTYRDKTVPKCPSRCCIIT